MFRKAIAVFVVLLVCVSQSFAAAAIVRAAKNDFGVTQTAITATLGAGVTAGSMCAVAAMMDSAVTDIVFSNGAGDTATNLTAATTFTAGGLKWKLGAFYTCTAGTTTFTATRTGTSPGFGDIFVWEISGLTSPIADKIVSADGDDSGSSGTLSSADEAAIGYFVSSGAMGPTAGSGWTITIGQDGLTPTTGSLGEHRVVAATTAINATATTAAGSSHSILATFMAGSAPAAAPASRSLLGVGK